MEEAAMTVEPSVPIRDNSVDEITFMPVAKIPMNILIISEEGGLQQKAFSLSDGAVIRYFQRLAGVNPYIFPEDSAIEQVASWRPHITWADMIIVDDPSFVNHMAKDFKVDDLTLVYSVDTRAYGEAGRLMCWLNPMTAGLLKNAIENVDTELSEIMPVEVKVSNSGRWDRFWSRLTGIKRG